ncbi:MAG: hypothetical protein WA077_23505, partial [Anaerolineae bacterium]
MMPDAPVAGRTGWQLSFPVSEPTPVTVTDDTPPPAAVLPVSAVNAGNAGNAGNEGNTATNLGSILRELVETVVLTLVIFFLVRTVMQNYRIDGISMEP